MLFFVILFYFFFYFLFFFLIFFFLFWFFYFYFFQEKYCGSKDSKGKGRSVLLLEWGSLCITPIQRFPRYILLFDSILHNLEKNHPLYTQTKKARDQINDFCRSINSQSFCKYFYFWFIFIFIFGLCLFFFLFFFYYFYFILFLFFIYFILLFLFYFLLLLPFLERIKETNVKVIW